MKTNYVLFPIMMKNCEIVVSKVSIEDVTYLSKYDWHIVHGYARTRLASGKTVAMHRLILGELDDEVDHINRDTLDNRRGNLRRASRAENNRNAVHSGANAYRGVSQRSANSWRAAIHHNGKKYAVGGLRSPEEAALKYNELALQLHGEYAVINAVPMEALVPLDEAA